MKCILYVTLFLSIIYSVSTAIAQNRVVVVPLGGGKSSPAPVPKTGQTLCYDMSCSVFIPPCLVVNCTDTGQDGELQKGVMVTPRFIDNNDGTVSDKLTGLVWLRNGACEIFFAGDNEPLGPHRPWFKALTATNELSSGYCGLTDGSVAGDWRLPNIRELSSLIDYSRTSPCLPAGHLFLDIDMWDYWSSTTVSDVTTFAWSVHFSSGMANHGIKTLSNRVLPVRGGQ